MIRLLLADDQSLFRQGLADLLALESDIEIVGQATQGREVIDYEAVGVVNQFF
jgi:DNA-binding NarL/FixJ family response regulator